MSRYALHRRPILALGMSLSVFVGSAVFVAGPWAGAGAADADAATSHVLKHVNNASEAVEGSVKVQFACDDASGAYSIAAQNVQVIEADGTTRWTTLGLSWTIEKVVKGVDHTDGGDLLLTQNATNGLFDASASGKLTDLQACQHNASFQLRGRDLDLAINIEALIR
jgi:hypothetical protein